MDILRLSTLIVCTLISISAPSYSFAGGALSREMLEQTVFYCSKNTNEKYGCSSQPTINDLFELRLPILMPVFTSDGVKAFRLMPSITNLSTNPIIGAKVRITINSQDPVSQEFLIDHFTKFKMSSPIDKSFLIRSDVPNYTLFYDALNDIYVNSSIYLIEISVVDVKFINQ